jgi:hypothetical protein
MIPVGTVGDCRRSWGDAGRTEGHTDHTERGRDRIDAGARTQGPRSRDDDAVGVRDHGDAGVSVPPPEVTAKATATPDTGLSFASVTRACSSAGRVAPGVATCASPARFASAAGAPPSPLAVKINRIAPIDAASVLMPTWVPSVQLPTAATPDASVVAEAPVTVPPPFATTNVTITPAIGAPPAYALLALWWERVPPCSRRRAPTSSPRRAA